jgi:hypothetical protein
MAKAEKTVVGKTKNESNAGVTFKCQACGKTRRLEEMRTIKRFFPMLVVCRECEKEMR